MLSRPALAVANGRSRTPALPVALHTNNAGNYDVVVCDLDGCLAPETSAPFHVPHLSQLAEHNRLAYEQRDRAVVTICTGRPLPFAEAMARLIQNKAVPLIAENGTWMYHPDDNRYIMDPAITAEHLEAVHAASQLLREKYAAHGVTQQPGKSAAVTLYHPDPAYLRDIVDDVRELLSERGWPFRVTMTWLYINCDLQFISKRSGIDRLKEATGLRAERLAGIGDTMSDLAIAESVAFFACPANADSEIKKRAHFVSEHEEVAGVLDILSQL